MLYASYRKLSHSSTMCAYNEIERKIMEYLIAGGQDTLEGITKWWLLDRTIQEETSKVKVALNHLLKEGLIEERQGLDSQVRYKIVDRRQ